MKVKSLDQVVHDDKISSVLPDLSQREAKVVLWDFDSILHLTLYSGKNELGERNPEYTEADLEYLQYKMTELYYKTVNAVEKYFDILNLYIFVKGENNFRKKLYTEYKANRTPPNPLINDLYNYAEIAFKTIKADGCEAEDYIYTVSKKINHTGIILSPDHDLDEVPCTLYDYRKGVWKKISEKEAIYNKYKKMVVGESGDNVNLLKGCGIKYFEKNFSIDFTIEQYEEALFNAFIKVYKDINIAREKMELNRELVCLKEIEL